MPATPTLPCAPTLDRLVRLTWAPFAGLMLAAAIGAADAPLDPDPPAVTARLDHTPDRAVTPGG